MAFGFIWSGKIKSEINHLYIHIPFCYSKCHYCAFYSQLDFSIDLQNEYFKALQNELSFYLNKYFINPETIYIGGGNPGCVPNLLNKIFSFLKECFELKDLKELTVECNPVNVNREFIDILTGNFVSRVSLGVQTFDEKSLLKINRIHQNKDIIENALTLLDSDDSLKNISIDLINGLPEVDYENELVSLNKSLKKYKKLNHISFYDLTIDEGSYFSLHGNNFLFPDEKKKDFLEKKIGEILQANNFIRYEISNWMRNSQMSHHNLAYWNYKDYLGLGAAAHSKVGRLRIENKPDIITYINEEKNKDFYILTEKESLEELLLMGFRTIYGIPRETLKVYSGSVKNFEKLISFLRDKDILDVRDDYRVVLNEKGRLFLDSILVDLFGLLDSF